MAKGKGLYDPIITDLIPDEVMKDVSKLNTWLAFFIPMFGMLYVMDRAVYDNNNEQTDDGGPSGGAATWLGFLDSYFKISHPMYAFSSLIFTDALGFKSPFDVAADVLGVEESQGKKGDWFTSPDWQMYRDAAKRDKNSMKMAVYGIVGDQFTRNCIMASGFASLAVYATYETDLLENMPPDDLSLDVDVA